MKKRVFNLLLALFTAMLAASLSAFLWSWIVADKHLGVSGRVSFERTVFAEGGESSDGDGESCSHKKFEDNVCTGCGAAAIAKLTDNIGSETRYFLNMKEAFNAVPDKSETDTVYTVTMLSDMEFGYDWHTIYGKRLTLDLGGKTLSIFWIEVKGGSELTVVGDGVMDEHSHIDVYGECKVYVKGGTIDSISVGSSTVGENGTVYLQGGTIGLSLYKVGDAVLTGGTLTDLIQADFTAQGTAPSVLLGELIPVGYVLEYDSEKGGDERGDFGDDIFGDRGRVTYAGKLRRDTGIKDNEALRRQYMNVVVCDHEHLGYIQDGSCVYCGAKNPIFYDLDGGDTDNSNPFYCSEEEDIILQNPTKNGYIFTGWSGTDLESVTQTVIIPKGSEGIREYTAHWEEKSDFSVMFDSCGGSAIAEKKNVRWTDRVLDGVDYPVKSGCRLECFTYDGVGIDEYTVYSDLAKRDDVKSITLAVRWDDYEAPVIAGLEDEKTYCFAVEFTVTDNDGVDYVMVDGVLVEPQDGVYVISPATWSQRVTAGDRSGNSATVTVTVNEGHTPAPDDGDCTTAVNCEFCGYEIIPAESGHDMSGWEQNLTTHTRKCRNAECSVAETENCSGGTATCTERAVCAVCGGEYGEVDADNHFGELRWVAIGNERHCLGWSCCRMETDETEAHEWQNGVCEKCGYTCSHEGHGPGPADYDNDHKCDICGETLTICADNDDDHKCDICGETLTKCADNDGDHKCDKCGKVLSEHTGGAATCVEKAVCDICKEEYGEFSAHSYKEEWSKDKDGHFHECSVCGERKDETAHTLERKIDKEATVTEKGETHEECSVCDYRGEPQIIEKLAPSITEGDDARWKKGGKDGLEFRSDAAASDFVAVLVDGEIVDSDKYVKGDDELVIELKAEYLETLSAGEHTIIVRSESGDARARFTVENKSLSVLWIAIAAIIVVPVVTAVAIAVFGKKKKPSGK